MGRLYLHKIGLLSFLVLVKSANINLTGPMETPALANVSVEKDLPSFPVMEITDAPDPVHLTTQPPSALERKDNLNNIQQSHLAPEENLDLTVEAVGMNALGEQSILEAAELSPTTTEVPPWRDTSLCPAGDTVETCQMKKGKCAHLGSVFTPFGGPLKSVTDCVNATGTTLSTDFYDYVAKWLSAGKIDALIGVSTVEEDLISAIRLCVLNATGLILSDLTVDREKVAKIVKMQLKYAQPPTLGDAVLSAIPYCPEPENLSSTMFANCLMRACTANITGTAMPEPDSSEEEHSKEDQYHAESNGKQEKTDHESPKEEHVEKFQSKSDPRDCSSNEEVTDSTNESIEEEETHMDHEDDPTLVDDHSQNKEPQHEESPTQEYNSPHQASLNGNAKPVAVPYEEQIYDGPVPPLHYGIPYYGSRKYDPYNEAERDYERYYFNPLMNMLPGDPSPFIAFPQFIPQAVEELVDEKMDKFVPFSSI